MIILDTLDSIFFSLYSKYQLEDLHLLQKSFVNVKKTKNYKKQSN